MTCENCIHFDICNENADGNIVELMGKPCFRFKDKDSITVFPCKIGDKVWFVPDNRNRRNIIETTVEKFVLKLGGIYMKLSCNAMYETTCRSIGKTVFLTQEEAEKALGERKTDGK